MFAIEKIERRPRYAKGDKRRIFFSPPPGEGTLEQMFARRHRPYREYRKLLPQVFEMAGMPADSKASWSQRAGCSFCPCSPGFLVPGYPGDAIWVTLAYDD